MYAFIEYIKKLIKYRLCYNIKKVFTSNTNFEFTFKFKYSHAGASFIEITHIFKKYLCYLLNSVLEKKKDQKLSWKFAVKLVSLISWKNCFFHFLVHSGILDKLKKKKKKNLKNSKKSIFIASYNKKEKW